MPGLFSTLDIASRGLAVNQRGLSVTSHNISNVDTPGYSRQRQELSSSTPIPDQRGNIGTGVEQDTVARVTDEFIQRRLVQEHARSGALEAEADALSQIENVFNEQGREGLTTRISELFDRFQDLAAASQAGQPTERESLRSEAGLLVDAVHRTDEALRNLQRATDRAIVDLVPEINRLTSQIADLNDEIVKLEVTAPANDLRDQRDGLMRELSEKIEVTHFENGDGSLVVLFEGGVPLVDRSRSAELQAVSDPTNPFDPTFSRVFYDDGSNFFDVTGRVGGGELGGLLRSRDVHAATALRDLDALVFTLADGINARHQAGFGLDGVGGRDFFAPLGAVDDAARSLGLSADVLASADAIAASDSAVVAETRGNTENAKLLADVRDLVTTSYRSGDAPGTPTGSDQTIIDQAAGTVAARGQEARSVEAARAQQERVLLETENRRDAIAGVSLDEEVTDLIRLQAAFQANSRVVTVVDRLLQELVSIV